jgi:hypothetical protein
MAKGKTNAPLVIYVAEPYAASPPVESLRQQGHVIVTFTEPPGNKADLILHPAAHQWNDMMWDFLPAALTAARKRKKEGKA